MIFNVYLSLVLVTSDESSFEIKQARQKAFKNFTSHMHAGVTFVNVQTFIFLILVLLRMTSIHMTELLKTTKQCMHSKSSVK